MHSIFGLLLILQYIQVYRCVLVVRKDAGPCKGTGTHLVLLRPNLIRKYEKKGEKSIGNRNHSGRKGGSYSRKKKECKKNQEGGISATAQLHVSP